MDEKEGDYVSSSENNSDSADIKHKKQKKCCFKLKHMLIINSILILIFKTKKKVKFVTINKPLTIQTLKEKEKK